MRSAAQHLVRVASEHQYQLYAVTTPRDQAIRRQRQRAWHQRFAAAIMTYVVEKFVDEDLNARTVNFRNLQLVLQPEHVFDAIQNGQLKASAYIGGLFCGTIWFRPFRPNFSVRRDVDWVLTGRGQPTWLGLEFSDWNGGVSATIPKRWELDRLRLNKALAQETSFIALCAPDSKFRGLPRELKRAIFEYVCHGGPRGEP